MQTAVVRMVQTDEPFSMLAVEVFLLGLLAVLFVLFFTGAIAVNALLKKWSALVDRFPGTPHPATERTSKPLRLSYIYFDVRGSMGPALLPATMSATESGLSVSPWWPIRCLCDPLLIPWSEFSGISKELFPLPNLWVSVGDPVVADLSLPLWVHRQMPL